MIIYVIPKLYFNAIAGAAPGVQQDGSKTLSREKVEIDQNCKTRRQIFYTCTAQNC